MRDRFIVSTGSKYKAGDTGGLDEVKLSIDEMPSHTHSGSTSVDGNHWHWISGGLRDTVSQNAPEGWDDDVVGDEADHGQYDPGKTESAGNHSHSLNINNTGGGKGHENRPPYYAVRFYIRAK